MSFAPGPSFTALILASGFLFIGLSRPLYAGVYGALLVVWLAVAAVGGLFRRRRVLARPDRQGSTPRRLALIAGFCCYVLFSALVLLQIGSAVHPILFDAPLSAGDYVGFNLDLSIFVALANLLLIHAGYRQVRGTRDFDRFFKTYFAAISIIWHLSFLIWLIEDNAVLLHYSEWSSSVFSGPLSNANHAGMVSVIAAAFYALQIIQVDHRGQPIPALASDKRTLLYLAQSLVFSYYALTSGSLMVYLIFSAIAGLLIFNVLSDRVRHHLLWISAAASIILGGLYFVLLFGADEGLLPMASFLDRQIIAREALPFIVDRPWLGYGTGSVYSALVGRSIEAIPDLIFLSAHNYYLDFLLQYGIPGFAAAFLGVFGIPMACLIGFSRRARNISPLGLAIWILWLVVLISSLTDFGLAIPSISMLLCFLTGAIYRVIIQDGAPLFQQEGSAAAGGQDTRIT